LSPVLLHPRAPVVDLGKIGVVRAAHQRDVFGGVGAAASVRVAVVELEPTALGTATTAAPDEGALVAVALPPEELVVGNVLQL
jgi:hypothetical protein